MGEDPVFNYIHKIVTNKKGCFVSPDGVYEYPKDSPSIVTKRARFKKFCGCMDDMRKIRSTINDTSDIRPVVMDVVTSIIKYNSK